MHSRRWRAHGSLGHLWRHFRQRRSSSSPRSLCHETLPASSSSSRCASYEIAGGGRDWLVNAVDGTIHAKHNPSLVLGVDTASPLVLVQRESPRQLNFGPPPKNDETILPFQDAHFGVLVGDKQHVGDYHVRSTKVSATLPSDALVSYQEDNFIVLKNSKKSSCRTHEMVLDVQDWNLREFQPVHFVEGPHWDSFASRGGGRDFVWEPTGIISLKLNPQLVLGRAAPSLILVHETDSKHKIALQHAQDFANGNKSVQLTLVGGGAIGQRFTETREYGPWRYIESQVVNDEKDAIVATYDGNFILAANGLALDVSFWNVEQGASVNFVGGNDDLSIIQQSDQELVKSTSALRGWSDKKGDSSSDSSSSSSSSDSSSSSESSSSSSDSGESSNDQENVSDNEVYEEEDFVIEDEAFDNAQEELDIVMLQDLPPVEAMRDVHRSGDD